MDESILYRLKNLNNNNVISISKDRFSIGRAKTNNISIENNPYISSNHCLFEYDNGHLYIRDTSSNGTLINLITKLSKTDSRYELHSGDVIYLVRRKDEPQSNIAFEVELPKRNNHENLSPYDEDTLMVSYSSIPSLSPNHTQENADLSVLMTTSENVQMKSTKPKDEPRKEFAMDAGDDMEDVLTCVCCQDIMSNPITLEPCLHAFCTSCYSSWEAVQRTCPKCRVKIIGKKKNYVINAILEAYLKAYPHKRPAEKPYDDEDSRSKKSKHDVGDNGMYLHNAQDDFDEEENDNDDDDDDVEDEEIDDAPDLPQNLVPNIRFACQQCPPATFAVAATAADTPGDFQCAINQNHILCQCCIQPMPDRRDEAGIHQQCDICRQFFCNLYFGGCKRNGCLGCLNRLRDFNFAPRHLTDLVNNNVVESQIVQDYLTKNNKTIGDFLVECCDRLDRNEFISTYMNRHVAIPSSKIMCYKCALKIFKDLAYQFRVRMKQEDIYPVTLRNRQNCFYGKNCRTQYTKLGHAQKLNHACDQTRN